MPLPIQFINFVIPIETIEKKYPGGLEQCIKDHGEPMPPRYCYDEYLFKDGAMSSGDMSLIISRWESMGFVGISKRDGKEIWLDFCEVDQLSGPTLQCDWIQQGNEPFTVSLVGKEEGTPFIHRHWKDR